MRETLALTLALILTLTAVGAAVLFALLLG
jgi:hypothetical protein